MNFSELLGTPALLQRAMDPGPVEMPTAVREMISSMTSAKETSFRFDTDLLEKLVIEQFFSQGENFSVNTFSQEHAERCVRAVRWVLQDLQTWTLEKPPSILRLRLLLVTLAAFEVLDESVSDLSMRFTNLQLSDGLRQLLDQEWPLQNMRYAALLKEFKEAGRRSDFLLLARLSRNFDRGLPPEIPAAIRLLYQVAPEVLVALINQKKDAIFSLAVCNVLPISASKLALSVDDATFKFFSVASFADVQPQNAPVGAIEKFRELLMQVAESKYWLGWLHAHYEYPMGNTVAEIALPMALAQLTTRHWADFLSSVQLSTNLRSAGPLANILASFYQGVGEKKAGKMWELAFQRWNKWDYGNAENDFNMLAPATCSFDFPVAMHYAHVSPDELRDEEVKLMEAITYVEQKWFDSQTHLITCRNRLLSRLRLLRHGQALALGASEPLPPPIQSDGDYAELRYHYYNANSR